MTLSGARLHLGKSDLTLSGELSDIRRAMLRGGKLKANFELESDLIDCNQLMLAIGKGLQFSDQFGIQFSWGLLGRQYLRTGDGSSISEYRG